MDVSYFDVNPLCFEVVYPAYSIRCYALNKFKWRDDAHSACKNAAASNN